MTRILNIVNEVVWGIPALGFILVVGVLLTIRSRFAQFRLLSKAIRKFTGSFRKRKRSKDGISSYRALCTALAATVGTGNIAGVAGAIAIGGPGVIFWMWVCAILGMIIKMAEVTLAMCYRKKNANGEYSGGPMYMITLGLPAKLHFLAGFYAFFGIVASFGVGNATQINAVIDGMRSIAEAKKVIFDIRETLLTGGVIAILITVAFAKGASGVGSWTEKLIPAASAIYILMGLGLLIFRIERIPDAIITIITGAFHPKSVTCGAVCAMLTTLRVGVSRGVFTNEAGMGTASIAHASAEAEHPAEQGLMGLIEVFLDTVVICTLTALVVLCSDVPLPYGTDPGIALTLDAFASVYGNWSRVVLTVLTCVFAFATILGWGLYGARCAQFLFGERIWHYFVITQAVCVLLGAVLNTSLVWVLAEILNALMAIPNLIALIFLLPEFTKSIQSYAIEKVHSS